MRKSVFNVLLVLLLAALFLYAEEEKAFNGLYLNLGNLCRLSHAKTRSISPENFTGEKGKGGMSVDGPAAKAARDLGQGWKVSPYVIIKPGETLVMAEISGPGAIQQIWMTPAGNWRFSIIRFYWDGEKEPSAARTGSRSTENTSPTQLHMPVCLRSFFLMASGSHRQD